MARVNIDRCGMGCVSFGRSSCRSATCLSRALARRVATLRELEASRPRNRCIPSADAGAGGFGPRCSSWQSLHCKGRLGEAVLDDTEPRTHRTLQSLQQPRASTAGACPGVGGSVAAERRRIERERDEGTSRLTLDLCCVWIC